MTYDEYKSFLLRTIWREGDTDLDADIEFYVKEAEALLSRDLKIQRMIDASATFQMTSPSAELPSDVSRLTAVVDQDTGAPLTVTTPSRLSELRVKYTTQIPAAYAIMGRTIWVAGPVDVSAPLNLLLSYYAKAPDFKATDTSWIVDDYFDLYNAAVKKHLGPAMKVDQSRQAQLDQFYAEKLASALAEDAGNMLPTSPLPSNMPANVW